MGRAGVRRFSGPGTGDAESISRQQQDPGTCLPPAPLPSGSHVSPGAELEPKRVPGGNGGETAAGRL